MSRSKFISFLFLVFVAGCSSTVERNPENIDLFIQGVVHGLEQVTLKSVFEIPVEDHDIYIPQHPLQDNFGNFLLVHQPIGGERCVYLLGPEGQFYAKIGRPGRGPGEFGTINHISLTPQNDLYVLDLMNSKVVRFKVHRRDVEFVDELVMDRTNLGGHFRSIHHMDGREWAVLASDGFRSNLSLVELGDSFRVVTEHLQIPYHFPDIHFSQSQRFTNGGWFSDEQTFNYFLYDSLVVYSYDVVTEVLERRALQWPHLNRTQTQLSQEFITRKFRSLEAPTLPGTPSQSSPSRSYDLIQLYTMARHGNTMVGAIQYYGGEHTYMLIHNFETSRTRYLRGPKDFHIQSLRGSKILGVKVGIDEPNRILELSF